MLMRLERPLFFCGVLMASVGATCGIILTGLGGGIFGLMYRPRTASTGGGMLLLSSAIAKQVHQ